MSHFAQSISGCSGPIRVDVGHHAPPITNETLVLMARPPTQRSTAVASRLALHLLGNHALVGLVFSFQPGIPGSYVAFVRSLLDRRPVPPLFMDVAGAWLATHSIDEFRRFAHLCPHLLLAPLMDQVASMGHLPVLRLLHDLGAPCTSAAMNLAAKHGHMDTIVFLHTHRVEGCTTSAMNWAAEFGYLDVVVFLHTHRREGCTKAALTRAAKAGHLDIVQFLDVHRSEGGYRDMLHGAIAAGHVSVVAYLTSHRPTEPCSPLALDDAARHGHLDMVEFLHTHRQEGCTAQALVDAAANGHAHVVRFLLDNNMPTNQPTLALVAVAACAQLTMLPLLQPIVDAKGWRKAIEAALKHRHENVLWWIQDHEPDAIEKYRKRAHGKGERSVVIALKGIQDMKRTPHAFDDSGCRPPCGDVI
ncbi:Aste57867_14119 [Aphanomyces stellatus]|uniref:Aste57867_14119 protein n=1 Tax=Aphanomyces stellatus TaxID=120398 RepID=A0A485L0R3_9STRA|nr:hypothetical protein As57867_014068 [Aphanomyces stellatus]VFT90946.1 Aste57867_14119 [Aphanomyces stellatus]